MYLLYPDLAWSHQAIKPSREVAAEARAMIAGLPVRWTPESEGHDPADILAVIGAMALTAAAGIPAAWDGTALRCRVCPVIDVVGTIQAAWEDTHSAILSVENRPVMRMAHEAPKLWIGQITAKRIWETNFSALFLEQPLERRWDDDANDCVRVKYNWDQRMQETHPLLPADGKKKAKRIAPSYTGYDSLVVGDPLALGFSPSAHPGMRIVGGRPAIELFGLIGAAHVERQGNWVTKRSPRLPDIAGAVLRDRVDLDRLLVVGPFAPVVVAIIGHGRGYLMG